MASTNKTGSAKKYANALFASVESSKLDHEETSLVLSTLSNTDIVLALRNPILNPADVLDAMKTILNKAGINCSTLMTNFLSVLTNNVRVDLLPLVSEMYRKMLDAKSGTKRAQLIQPVIQPELNEAVSSLVKSILPDTKIAEVENVQDESILSGFIIKLDNQILDNSGTGKTRRIFKEIRAKLND